MIEKRSPRKNSKVSTHFTNNNIMHTLIPQSPSVRSISTFSNLRKPHFGSGSTSNTTSRSSSPVRSISSRSDPFSQPGKIRLVKNNSNGNNPQQKYKSYTGNISVTIRPKPFHIHDRDTWLVTNRNTIMHHEVGEFHFDDVFAPESSNLDIYQKTCKPLIDKLMQGFNATVFAYGITGSGKTFTMTGTEDNVGLVPLSVS